VKRKLLRFDVIEKNVFKTTKEEEKHNPATIDRTDPVKNFRPDPVMLTKKKILRGKIF